MAASCGTAARTALTGLYFAPYRLLLTQRVQAPTVCHRLRLHVSPPAGQCTSRSSAGRGVEEEQLEGPEYIPKRKAKNPMMKIGYAWMIGLPTGIIGFLLAKRQVDKNRLKQLKIRQRMKHSNKGEYEGSRYRQHANSVGLNR